MSDNTTENAEQPAEKPKFSKIFIGESGPSMWRPGMAVANPLENGLSALDL